MCEQMAAQLIAVLFLGTVCALLFHDAAHSTHSIRANPNETEEQKSRRLQCCNRESQHDRLFFSDERDAVDGIDTFTSGYCGIKINKSRQNIHRMDSKEGIMANDGCPVQLSTYFFHRCAPKAERARSFFLQFLSSSVFMMCFCIPPMLLHLLQHCCSEASAQFRFFDVCLGKKHDEAGFEP
jgi:hypothetical protein